MCPQKPTKWKSNSPYKKEPLCCEPEACKATADAMADAYVTALEAAYRARKIPAGWFGNLCVSIVKIVTNEPNEDFGQTYSDEQVPYLTCAGWENMAYKILGKDFELVNDPCWSYTKEQRLAPERKGKQGGHKWGTLRVMDGTPKILDPWKSGGYGY